MKRFALAIALACVLSGSALAGDSHTAGSPAPGNTPIGGEPVPGEMPGGGDQGNGGERESGGLAAILTILDLVF